MEEAKIASNEGGLVLASNLEFAASTRTARGSLDEAFREGLFLVPYGPSYYAGYTEGEDVLAVADPEWEVEVWEETEDGELEKVATVEDDDVEVEGPDEDGKVTVVVHEDHHEDWDWGRTWGSLSVGTGFIPLNPEGTVRLPESRVNQNQFNGFADSGFGRHIRGFDARWSIFEAANYKDYPRVDGFLRLGYDRGQMSFDPEFPEDTEAMTGGYEDGDVRSLEYHSVPVFLGGNLYAFRKFPVRPYAGAGFGFDFVRLTYQRQGRDPFEDVTARIGFELHAGLDIRITNYISLTGEIRQLWSARKKYSKVPDFSNTGATAIVGLRVGFPLGPKARKRHHGGTTRIEITEETVDAGGPPPPPPPPAAAPPAPSRKLDFANAGNCPAGDCEITCGDDCESECLGGDCEQTCKAGNSCQFNCIGGDCKQRCEAGSKCELSCLGGDCIQACKDADSCNATCRGGDCKR